MSDTPLLELENISKFYGNIIALQGVTTEVRAGQVEERHIVPSFIS